MRTILALASAALFAVPLAAQSPDSTAATIAPWVRALLGLPSVSDEIRRAGVPDTTVRNVLDKLRKQQASPEEVHAVLVAERDAARDHGPTDNFGAFVQQQLDAGLRGRDLAAAIRAEHEAHGKGKPARTGKPDDDGDRMNEGRSPKEGNARGKPSDDHANDTKGERPQGGVEKGKRPDASVAPRNKADSAAAKNRRRPN